MAEYSPGLEGVIAGETSICSIGEEGLAYRGYPIAELAERCSFEEVAFLLLRGELPSATELETFCRELRAARSLAPGLPELVRQLPASAAPMDTLRSAVSLQAHFERQSSSCEAEALRLLAQMPALIGEWHRSRGGAAEPIGAPPDGHAAYLLWHITGSAPEPEAVRLFDTSLILYAEHELNASTFAARVVVSTGSDLHSGIVAAIGALKGPLHGGANERAMEMLAEIGSPEAVGPWLEARLARKERIMGFGHRVVRRGDRRATILHDRGAELARQRGDTRLLETADAIQELMDRQKGLKPNVDFPCAWVYHLLGIPTDLYTPVFAAARVAGWSAHILEQLANNRLIRPRALYQGAEIRHLDAA
jgi:citrate synthase